MTPATPAPECAICRLHQEAAKAGAGAEFEIGRGGLWLLRHHPDPAPLAGWLLLDARRHLGGALAFDDREAAGWGPAVRMASRLVQELSGCERVYAIAFGEGAPHLHLHLIPRHAADPASAAWRVADLYRAVEAGGASRRRSGPGAAAGGPGAAVAEAATARLPGLSLSPAARHGSLRSRARFVTLWRRSGTSLRWPSPIPARSSTPSAPGR